jgi:diguanylate cyclase (GGDEF)-like protein
MDGSGTMQNIIVIYYVCAGISFFAGIQSLTMLVARHRTVLFITYFLLCFCISGFLCATAWLYSSSEIIEASSAIQTQTLFALIFTIVFVFFMSAYSYQRISNVFLAIVSCVFVILVVANYMNPAGLKYTEIEYAGRIEFSWSESVQLFTGVFSPWNAVFRLWLFSIFVWIVWLAISRFRAGRHNESLVILSYAVAQFLASLHALFIELKYVQPIYVTGFIYLFMVLIVNYNISKDLLRRNISLRVTTDSLLENINKRGKAQEEIDYMAYFDSLTGLPNRWLLHEHLDNLIEENQTNKKFSTLMIFDLDHFKNINDSLGHDVGDRLLKKVALRLKKVVPEEAFVGRFGGDEFVVSLPATHESEEQCDQYAKELIATISQELRAPFYVGKLELNAGASIGYCNFKSCETSNIELLSRIDLALHVAKKSGRNTFRCFNSEMSNKAARKHELESALHSAIEENQFQLYYQPQLDSVGKLYGAEGLLRWFHPTLGEVSPVEFIPIAEESGLIHEIGRWVINEGCIALQDWLATQPRFTGSLSLNVSPWQFVKPDFVDEMLAIFQQYNTPPERIKIEITETAFLYDKSETISKLNQLRSLGYSVVMDDFGTGYSSLAHIRDLPLDLIKIDRAFISTLEEGNEQPLVKSIISMCDYMSINVLAEGVESEFQKGRLIDYGCHLFQGYLFSKPINKRAFEKFLKALV